MEDDGGSELDRPPPQGSTRGGGEAENLEHGDGNGPSLAGPPPWRQPVKEGWISVRGANPTLKWSEVEPGFALEGIWRGVTKGRFTPLGSLLVEGGEISVFPLPTVLADQMADVKVGSMVRIEYGGLQLMEKSGRQAHVFEVGVKAPSDLVANGAHGTDDEVPF
jgi:hypothetical protein